MDGTAKYEVDGEQAMRSAIDNNLHACPPSHSDLFLADQACADKGDRFCSLVAKNDDSFSLHHFSVEKTRSGMVVVLLNHLSSGMVLPKLQYESSQLVFFSLYSGKITMDWEARKEHGRASFTPGNYVLSCGAGRYGLSIMPGAPCKAIGIILTPEILESIVGVDLHSVALSRISRDAEGVCTCWEDSIPSAQASFAGAQLLGCPMIGKGRKLYLESKSMELLSVYFGMLQGERLCFDGNSSRNTIQRSGLDGFSKDDVQKLYDARNILIERMADPPCILELSRLCCLNEFKLKKGFKKVFKQTVFEYLRKERMAKAKQFIEENGYSVSNAAYEVGYSSVSRFIATFKGEYGATPGALCLRKK